MQCAPTRARFDSEHRNAYRLPIYGHLQRYLVVPAKSNFSNFPLAKLGSASFKFVSRLVLVNHRSLPNLRQPNQPHDERQKAFQP